MQEIQLILIKHIYSAFLASNVLKFADGATEAEAVGNLIKKYPGLFSQVHQLASGSSPAEAIGQLVYQNPSLFGLKILAAEPEIKIKRYRPWAKYTAHQELHPNSS